MSTIFGPTFDVVESAMRFRVARQGVLSTNVANADTPGYRRFELSFDQLLDGEIATLRTSDPRHLPTANATGEGYRLDRGDYGDRPDRNGVDLDHELLQVSRNAGAFTQQAEVLTRLLSMRRIAATGEAR